MGLRIIFSPDVGRGWSDALTPASPKAEIANFLAVCIRDGKMSRFPSFFFMFACYAACFPTFSHSDMFFGNIFDILHFFF